MDLYGSNSAAISLGNARREQVRDLNERIRQHNSDVADKFAQLKSQESSADTLKQLKETGQALWSGKGMPDKIKAYQDYRAKQAAKASNPVDEAANTQREGSELSLKQKIFGKQEVTSPPAETVEEGGLGRATTEATESAATDIGDSLETATGGALKGALKTEGQELAETVMSKGLGVAGKAAGGLFGAAQGGLDIYEDIQAKGIAGNNNWEKAGNLLQIGGAAADLVGMAFPPAAVLGGVLDLASGAVNEVGEKLDEDKEASDLQTQQESETVQEVADPVQATVTTGRLQ